MVKGSSTNAYFLIIFWENYNFVLLSRYTHILPDIGYDNFDFRIPRLWDDII